MIVVSIQMWPGGDAKKARTLALGTIINNGVTSGETNGLRGTYDVAIQRKDGRLFAARIADFPRERLNVLDLLLRGLVLTHGSRNRKFIKENT